MSLVRAASVTARAALAKRAAPLAPIAFAGARGLAVHAARSAGGAGGAGRATAAAVPLATIGLAAAGLTAFVSADDSVDYAAVRKAIADLLDVEGYDDGSYGPLLVRLAWHASGTYDKSDGTGGSNGATMRFKPESSDGANAGLDKARAILEPVKAKFPGISYADLWTLAGCVAIEEMGGPAIAWRAGRADEAPGTTKIPPNGRLPDAAQGASHVRDVFKRQGFNDREIVALAGAHALGRCHANRSGFEGAWTNAPTTFSNEYFRLLLEESEKWAKGKVPSTGNVQFYNKDKSLMMLPADIAIARDPEMRKYVELYAKDEDTFSKDFASAFKKLIENGVPFPAESKTLWQRIFG